MTIGQRGTKTQTKVVFVVLLDLSAAFDAIDHRICIVRLSERIGVRGTALNWFRSYLEDWSTQVDIDGELSDLVISRFGLPQGSVVGPIGFTAYILPVGDIARYHNVSSFFYTHNKTAFSCTLNIITRV